jgi:hypothetical protein
MATQFEFENPPESKDSPVDTETTQKEPINPEGNQAFDGSPSAGEPDKQGDPFDELFKNAVSDAAFVSQSPGEKETTEIGTEGTPKEDNTQFQYWQSQADKYKSELESMKQGYDELQQLAPIARYIQTNPQILDSVEQSLSSGQPTGQPQQRVQEESLKKPERPTKPSNYDPIDAYSDPESASYRFRESLDSYRDSVIEYQEKQHETIVQQMQAEAQKQQQEASLGNIKTQLVQGYNLPSDEADKFMREMFSPDSYNLDNLMTLWKIKQMPAEETTKNLQKAAEMQRQKEKLSIPRPVGVAPAESKTQGPIEDQLMDAMIGDYEKQNPW